MLAFLPMLTTARICMPLCIGALCIHVHTELSAGARVYSVRPVGLIMILSTEP